MVHHQPGSREGEQLEGALPAYSRETEVVRDQLSSRFLDEELEPVQVVGVERIRATDVRGNAVKMDEEVAPPLLQQDSSFPLREEIVLEHHFNRLKLAAPTREGWKKGLAKGDPKDWGLPLHGFGTN